MTQSRSAAAFSRLPQVLGMLRAHPAGLPLSYLAQEVGVSETDLRREILAFYSAEMMGVRPDVIQFLAPDGVESDDPSAAPIIRVVSDTPVAELGIEYLPADRWLTLYRSARALLEIEPDNTTLSEVAAIIEERILSGVTSQPHPTGVAAQVMTAVQQQVAVDIVYSRLWQPGVVRRRVHPLRMFQGVRGWEVDAFQPANGHVRTFLVDRIRESTLTDEHFTPPANIDEILRAQRRTLTVELNIPQGFRWVVDRFAEASRATAEDEESVTVEADFIPPVADRVGLVLAIAGPDAFVIDPPELADEGRLLARHLLAQHALQ